jgi:hypothetical protein
LSPQPLRSKSSDTVSGVDCRFEGLPLIPYLTSSNETFERAKELVSVYLEALIKKHTSYTSQDDDERSYFLRYLRCDMIIFLSVLPSSGVTPESLALYEDEMRYPTGQTVVKPPAMELSGVMYSPDCGTALEWRNEGAVKVERFWRAGRIVGITAGLIAVVQVWCVLKEMAERGSPSVSSNCDHYLLQSVSKVSLWTVAMQALMSGYLCVIYLVTAVLLGMSHIAHVLR